MEQNVKVKDILLRERTPLHCSARSGHTETVKLLIQHGADVNVKDKNEETPLHYSAWSGHRETVNLLIKHGAEVNVKDIDGQTPLHRSAWSGQTEIVNLLIQHLADINVKDNLGQTPLHRSAGSGHKEIVNLLIQHNADVNVKDEYGVTPLHRSAWLGHTETVKLLIQHGADIDPVAVSGSTPLMLAESYGHRHIVKILRQATSIQAGDGRLRKFFGIFSGYSSRTRNLSIQTSDGKGQVTTVKYEDKEVRSNVTGAASTLETGREGKVDNVKVTTKKGSQGHKKQELVSNSAKTSSYDTISEVDACTSHGLSSQLLTLPLESSATTSLQPSSSLPPLPLKRRPAPCPPPPPPPCPPPQRRRPLPPPPPRRPLPPPSPPPSPPSKPPRRPLPPPSPPTPRIPAAASPQSPQRLPRPPQPSPRDKVTRLAKEMLRAVNERKSDEDDGGVCQDQDYFNVPSDNSGGSVIVIQQKTENHYHYPKCDCNNKEDTREKVRVETSETLDVSVGSTRYDLLYPPDGDDYEIEDEDEFIYRTGEDRETVEGRSDRQTLDVDKMAKTTAQSSSPMTTTTSPSSATSSTTTCTSVAELRRRLESQAGYMEKMVQSCVAGGGVCQDQSSDLVPLHHGGLPVPVNINFIMQPKHVEVWSARQMNVERAEVENAEMMPVNSTCNFNYAAQKSSDDEDNEDNTDDDNSEDDKEIQIEHDENNEDNIDNDTS